MHNNFFIRLTIIIPVFNVEKYLADALKGIIKQNLREIEIIIIDDGSSDGSSGICKQFQKKDDRIQYIKLPENRGYGYACNKGIRMASGEYLTIFEPDDFIKKETYKEVLNKACEFDLDLIRFGFYKYKDGKIIESGYRKLIDNLKIPANQVICIEDYPDILSYQPTVWAFVYKTDFIRKHSICFLETPGASYQDNSFYFKSLMLSERMMVLNKCYYYWRQHSEQSIHNKSKVNAPLVELDEIKRFINSVIKTKCSPQTYELFYLQFIKRSLFYFNIHFNRLLLELKPMFYDNYLPFITASLFEHQLERVFYSQLDKKRRTIYNSLRNVNSYEDYLLNQGLYTQNNELKTLKGKKIYGQTIPIERLTPPFEHYLFGYFDLKATNNEGRNHLALRVPYPDKLPASNDSAAICLIKENLEIETVDKTHAWCFQQACFLQYRPQSDEEIIYNIYDENDQAYKSVILNLRTQRKRILPKPVASISPDGRRAISINFSRLYDYRPGYGYCNIVDPYYSDVKPENDGIIIMNIDTGEYSLLVSYRELWEKFAEGHDIEKMKLVINHVSFNTYGTRVLFLLRFFSDTPPWPTITAVMDLKGNNIKQVFGFGSHYYWKNDKELIITGENVFNRNERTFTTLYHLNVETGEHYMIDQDFFTGDGHCSYSPDQNYILYDSYPKQKIPYRKLMLYDVNKNCGTTLIYLLSDPVVHGNNKDCRCDLHPRWSPDGRYITFDSIHEGFRGIYRIKTEDAIEVLEKKYTQLTMKELETILNVDPRTLGIKDLSKQLMKKVYRRIKSTIKKRSIKCTILLLSALD